MANKTHKTWVENSGNGDESFLIDIEVAYEMNGYKILISNVQAILN